MFATSSRVSFIGLALVGLSTQVALAGTESRSRFEGEVESAVSECVAEISDIYDEEDTATDEEDTATDAVLLFETGFEDCTDLSTVEEYFDVKEYENNRQGALQYFSGSERSTDFEWPPDLPWLSLEYADLDGVAAPIYINNVVGEGNKEPTYYMLNKLVEDVGPDGSETRALFMKMMNNPDGTETGQNNLVMRFDESAEAPPLYIKYSMKPSKWIYETLRQDGIGQRRGKVPMWHLISEMKAGSPANFRLQVLISINERDRRPSYQLRADTCETDEDTGEYSCSPDGKPLWSVVVPIDHYRKWERGEWMPVEIYLDRNPEDDTDGRFYVAINGQMIGDISADDIYPETGDTFEFWDADDTPQTLWFLQTLYGLRTVVEEDPTASDYSVLIDDLEIWDDFPCTDLPCEDPYE